MTPLPFTDAMTQLQDAYQHLEAVNGGLRASLSRWRGPMSLDARYGSRGAEDRRVAALCMTRLFHDDLMEPDTDGSEVEALYPRSGVLCIDEALAEQITALNDAKDAFKIAVRQVKAQIPSNPHIRIEDLITRMIGDDERRQRDPNVAHALSLISASRIDLIKAYRKITILPAKTDVVSFTWVTRRDKGRQRTRDEALVLAEDTITDTQHLTWVQTELAKYPPDTLFYEKQGRTPPQLRANVQHIAPDGTRVTSTVSASTILCVPENTLPTIRWPREPDPNGSDRLLRRDRRLEDAPFIEALRLHRYRERTE